MIYEHILNCAYIFIYTCKCIQIHSKTCRPREGMREEEKEEEREREKIINFGVNDPN